MALFVHPRLIRNGSLVVRRLVSSLQGHASSVYEGELILINTFELPRVTNLCPKSHHNCCLSPIRLFSSIPNGLFCERPSSEVDMLKKLENALKNHQIDEAWKNFQEFKNSYGLPEGSLVNRLITELSYSANSHWLRKASNLVLLLQKGRTNTNVLRSDFLIKLALSLSRAQMPVPASMILRSILKKDSALPMDILCLIIMHMVKTEIGTHLASNILVEICEEIQLLKSNSSKLKKPDTMIFNIVLDACARFKSSFKGQQLMELMAQVGVIADAHSIVIIAQIHEMNGRRDELRKFKVHIDQLSTQFLRHYRSFYDSLLSLHFKFNDIESASELVMDLHKLKQSFSDQITKRESQKPCYVSIGSDNLKSGLKLQIMPGLLQKESILDVSGKHELINYTKQKLVLSKRGLAKLIGLYKRNGKINELSKFLTRVGNGNDFSFEVINAFIYLGELETAHDILEDMEMAGLSMDLNVYMSLMEAYKSRKMFREEKALSNQMKKRGLTFENTKSTEASSFIEKSDLSKVLAMEISNEVNKAITSILYELNSSIYLFFKAKMIDDARKTYRKMQEMNLKPTSQTYSILVHGYSSLEMYREITIIWSDMKRYKVKGVLVISRDLYEFLLMSFIRGGFFERVMEIIGYMKDENVFADKLMYRSEFLKYHKDLYRNLVVVEVVNEAQSKRLEFVFEFKKWVGID